MSDSIDIEKYRGWAIKLARPLAESRSQSVLESEFYADACLGLVRAAKAYRPELGYHFSTLARKCIWREIREGIRVRRNTKKVDGRDVRLGFSTEYAVKISDSGDSVPHMADLEYQSKRLHELIETLPDRCKTVVMMRMEGHTLQEVADHFGFTREWARQEESQAHEKIRKGLQTRITQLVEAK